MAEETKQPVTPTGSTTGEATAGVVEKTAQEDYLAMLKARDEKIAKLAQDRDNYRTGMLKYKKLSEENPDDKSLDEERVKQMIREEMINSEIGRAQAEKDDLIEKMAKENSEMKIAIANKSQISNLPGGSSQGQETTVDKLTDEQKAHFERISKEIGVKIDPAKFLENWEKSKLK